MGVIKSLLDTDLYKLTMQAAVRQHFPNVEVAYAFRNRTPEMKLSKEAVDWVSDEILQLKELRFSEEEIAFLAEAVPSLPKDYLSYLKDVKLNPESEVTVKYDDDIHISIQGQWHTTILYEIPVLALVSEAYFKFVDKDWSYDGQVDKAADKCKALIDNSCIFSDFGTRRRRSYHSHKLVIEGLVKGAQATANPQFFVGTSNVHFAKEFGLKPVGTVAHEWFMGIAAYYDDYKHANKTALELWLKTYPGPNSGFALTDTFGTPDFLKCYNNEFLDTFWGVRQDSGDPEEYTKLLGDFYRKKGVAPNSKRIIYSDSLNVEKCEVLRKVAVENGLVPSFGIGTFLTNDFQRLSDPTKRSVPLNIVIKISEVEGKPALKLSDDLGKNMGDSELVNRVKKELGYHGDKFADESKRW